MMRKLNDSYVQMLDITSIIKDTKGNNLFCYCFNNPIKYERYECELAKMD